MKPPLKWFIYTDGKPQTLITDYIPDGTTVFQACILYQIAKKMLDYGQVGQLLESGFEANNSRKDLTKVNFFTS